MQMTRKLAIVKSIQVAPRLFSTINSASDSANIGWKNDVPGFPEEHNTTLSMAALRQLSSSGSLPGQQKDSFRPTALWVQEPLNLVDYDYRAIAARIGPVKDTFYGYTWDVRTVPDAINAAYTSNDLGFHTELLYFEQPPHIQLLHCVQSASSGGASVFADAFNAAVDLFHMDVDAFDTLATVPVNYHYNHPDSNVYRTTKPEHLTDHALSALNNKVDWWHQAASKFNALLQRSECLYERKMRPGECVLFNNTRILHSRGAFDMADIGKPRWLRGTYVDKDPYFSKLRVLQHKFR
ncbi:hypothetical protein BDV36DRAFT_284264 [Aspergillus pseudocaelatus]|uniref:TauD/TfdA-like domain-containing protein n=1 Tax=Aspergillus pseudocaelatus TaxID=1825620 RepID=A0ABQ6WHX8_9EURO|nr:hypothetical protein BDV36DRAFT_284264 [Aspergillus pseudocaelatus]